MCSWLSGSLHLCPVACWVLTLVLCAWLSWALSTSRPDTLPSYYLQHERRSGWANLSGESLQRSSLGELQYCSHGGLGSWGLYISIHTWTRGRSCHSHASEALTSLTWTHIEVYLLPTILSILFLPIQFSNWNSRDLIGLFIHPQLDFEQTTELDSESYFYGHTLSE